MRLTLESEDSKGENRSDHYEGDKNDGRFKAGYATLVSEDCSWRIIWSDESGHLVYLSATVRPTTPVTESTMDQPARSGNS